MQELAEGENLNLADNTPAVVQIRMFSLHTHNEIRHECGLAAACNNSRDARNRKLEANPGDAFGQILKRVWCRTVRAMKEQHARDVEQWGRELRRNSEGEEGRIRRWRALSRHVFRAHLVHDWFKWFGSQFGEVDRRVLVLVHLAHHSAVNQAERREKRGERSRAESESVRCKEARRQRGRTGRGGEKEEDGG